MFRQAMQCFEEVPRRTVPHLQCIVEEKDRLEQKKNRRFWPLFLLSMMTL
jgi:hypothetical protein